MGKVYRYNEIMKLRNYIKASCTTLGLSVLLTVTGVGVASADTVDDVISQLPETSFVNPDTIVGVHAWDTRTVDGDTFWFVTADDHREQKVRFVGVQAPELHRYRRNLDHVRGDCGGVTSARLLQRLTEGKQVFLWSRDPASQSRHRAKRSVAVQVEGGRWVDVGSVLVASGAVLPWAEDATEFQWNGLYTDLAAKAMREGRGLWGRGWCENFKGDLVPGVTSGNENGSSVGRKVVLGVSPVGRGNESFTVTNVSEGKLDLKRWVFRDTNLHYFKIKHRTVLNVGETLTVKLGRGHGKDSRLVKHWRTRKNIFNELVPWCVVADGVFGFDSSGVLAAWRGYGEFEKLNLTS
jgi:endonuclease YncB( thermonuclease family)